MSSAVRTLPLLLLLVAGGIAAQAPAPDLVLTGGRVFTGEAPRRFAEALAIRGDRIVAVGTRAEIDALAGSGTRSRTCRRASGAPAMAWATFRRADFAWTRSRPVEHRSSPPVLRGFCGACGSALTYTSELEAATLDVTTASLDDPEALPLEDHIWTAHGLSWMQVDDGRPRFRRRRGDG